MALALSGSHKGVVSSTKMTHVFFVTLELCLGFVFALLIMSDDFVSGLFAATTIVVAASVVVLHHNITQDRKNGS